MQLNFYCALLQVVHHTTVDLPKQEPELSANLILLHNLEVFFHYTHFFMTAATVPTAIIPDTLGLGISHKDLLRLQLADL